MNPVIGLISIVDLVRDRHRAVGGDGESQDQLLQVRAMVLVLSVGQSLWTLQSTYFPAKVTVVVSW